jgi:hypothetical protein
MTSMTKQCTSGLYLGTPESNCANIASSELLNLALSVYGSKEKDGVHDVRGEIARTKYVKSLVAGALGREDEALALKEEAGTIHRMITGSAVEEDTASESYDLLVAYFYR